MGKVKVTCPKAGNNTTVKEQGYKPTIYKKEYEQTPNICHRKQTPDKYRL